MNKYKEHSKAAIRGPYIEALMRACLKKRTYKTKSKGKVQLPGTQIVYKCSFCKLYHRASKETSIWKINKQNKQRK